MKKIDRSAFLYLDGHSISFAQCGSCSLNDHGKCVILDIAIGAGDTCGLYVPGRFAGMTVKDRVSLKEAGYLRDTQVRCENCLYDGQHIQTPRQQRQHYCKLFEMINRALPLRFELDTKIEPCGCCNAWTKAA